MQNLIAIPDSIGFVEAAAFPLAFLTAWHMLITRAKLRAGEDVLVLGAGSGVGQAAIQIAWRHGARVFATAGTDEKLAKARQLGAYEVINHTTQDVPAKIREFTNGRGVDVVVRARRHRDLGPQPEEPRSRRTAGDVRRHHRARRADRPARAVYVGRFRCWAPTWAAKAELLRAAQFFFAGELRPGRRSHVPPGGGCRGAPPARIARSSSASSSSWPETTAALRPSKG